MLEATTRIYVRDPEREDDLVPAVVSETLGQKIMVRFLQPVSFNPGVDTVAFFHNQSDCFTSVPCQMQRMFSKGQYPTGALILTGEEEVAENRSSFRIDVNDRSVAATVNNEAKGEVVNISCGGIAILLESDAYEEDSWLDVILQHDGSEHRGRMQVRSKFKDKSGRFRYGLMADPAEANLASQLTRITQALQGFVKASRKSQAEVENKAEASPSQSEAEDLSAAVKTGAAKIKQAKPVAPKDSNRIHQRNPWPGMAKVYVREEHNMRVLSVDTGDLSRGGISFTSPQYIYEGSEVLFEKPITGGFFRVMVQIKNVRVLGGGAHRIGGQFLGAPLQPGKMPEAFRDAANAA
ncbi:MAG: PilZ domain-containing protein [Phycisphaeraceae bacterium]